MSEPSFQILEAPSERVLIPKSVIHYDGCQARINVATSWDYVQCPCGKVMRLRCYAGLSRSGLLIWAYEPR